MNYRHAFHVGNFADVVKHLALVVLLLHLKKKEKPFHVIDTHAGRGLYDLGSDKAQRTNESRDGIEKLMGLDPASQPEPLKTYLSLVHEAGVARYPGSPLIAARLLRKNDRLTAVEMHREEFAALADALAPFPNAKAVEASGYGRLAALVPPAERRGLVLIDPPYEAPDEFAEVGWSTANAFRRFSTGIFAVWFPVKSPSEADRLCGEIMAAGAVKLTRIDVEVDAKPGDKERLARAGLAIVNPPFGFDEEMRAALEIAAPLLGARSEVARLGAAR